MKMLPVFLSLSLGLSSTTRAQVNVTRIQNLIQKEIDSKRSKSIIIGVIDSTGRQTFSAGVLSDNDQRRPDGNTIYEIGSITKLFTGLLLADMSLKREVRLDDPISRFRPAHIKGPPVDGIDITLLHLATHRSGLPRNPYILDPGNLENPFADYSTKQLYESISGLKYDPATKPRFRYSNLGYNLLGHILTLVADKDFEALLKERITRPFAMKNTVITLTPELRKNMATPHSAYGTPVMEWDIAFAGGGGLRSNMNDMLSFAAANLGLLNTTLLPAIELSHIPHAKKDGTDGSIALGWTVFNENGEHIVWKDGSTGGYHTFIGLDKKNKRGVVVLSNSVNSITDIGLHLLDSTRDIVSYRYPWRVHDTVYSTVQEKGVEKGIALYKALKESKISGFVFDEHQLNYIGNDLRKANRIKEAIKIYQFNLEEYPNSVLTYESLAEIYKRTGDKELAITTFERLAVIDQNNPRWNWMINKLKNQ